ncbi:DEAD/DEAH box helicase [Shewanella aestuarii]|uniref:DEAD/DEAH box helicase family protein n=1 Tax=Shewanella aestuarii TaxID=1028752 RepID=A0A6G9QI25_9GAMM|nr:DEAD/DEAH box helicase [Shewanella aestuarii]QIR14122.1 DEAD/DEAH box helicase family protein [Shewanella aestuarii]
MSAKLFNLPIKLSHELIGKLFSATQIQKAQNYLIQGRVLQVTASHDNHDIEAYTQGAIEEPYRQDISLVNVNHKVIMRSYCTCPVRRDCKHVAAALLALIDNKPVEEQRVAQWLSQLDKLDTIQPVINDEYAEPNRIIYCLSSDPHGVYVELKNSKLNKKGTYNRGSKLIINDLRLHLPWWISPEDKQLIGLLFANNLQGNKIYLEGEIGYIALMKMLDAEVAFWEENRFPLKLSQAIKPEFIWAEMDKNHRQMQMVMPGLDNWEFIATEPALYIELDYLQLGKIDTELSAERLQLLQKMPPVNKSQLDKISHALLLHFPSKVVPIPTEIEFQEISQQLNTRLTFCLVDRADSPAFLQPAIKVEHCYGEIKFAASEQFEHISLLKKGNVQYQIHRQAEQEQHNMAQLRELGLQALSVDILPPSLDKQYFVSIGLLPEAIIDWSALSSQRIDELTELGFDVHFASDFDLNIVDAQLDVDLVDEDESGWFSLSLNADIDGQRISLLALVARWLQQHGEPDDEQELLLPSDNGRFIKIKAKSIKPLISIIQELFHRHSSDELQIPRSRAHLLNDLSESEVRLLNGERVRLLASKLASFNGVQPIDLPNDLNATLRDYQKQGFDWLCFLKEYQLGGILADDMGLGKTVQALAFLLHVKQQTLPAKRKPSLIICPTSLVGNWQKEAEKFTPDLNLIVIHGNQRHQWLAELDQYDVIVTTYPLIIRDEDIYHEHVFEHIILDEAQQIKNAQAKATQVIKTLKGHFRLCLSGTPLENHLGELKSLMDFCLPGLLGQQTYFNKEFRTPIEKQADIEKSRLLTQRISPFMLRRTKTQVVAELPEKTEIVQSLELEKDQRNLYESIRLVMEKKLRELFAKKGVSSSHIEFLDALLKLRQACCDPRLVKLEQAQKVTDNAKLNWLVQNLPEMIEEGRKILIFSQFTSMLSLIEQELTALDIPYSLLTGKTLQRQQQIDAFQDGDNPVFLISLKAGGTGLNLTAADTVIHYDPWWNPAAERQATDRAYRIGQENPVFVYKLIAQGTVEEKIQAMQQHKQGLADNILSDGTQGPWKGSAEDLLALLR